MSPLQNKGLIVAMGIAVVIAPAAAEAQVGQNSVVANPNTAGEAELLALPHVDAALAKLLLEKRPFLSITALDEVVGQSLDQAQRGELYPKLFIPINLNEAP